MTLYEKSVESILANFSATEAIVRLQNEKSGYPERPTPPIAYGLSTPEQYEEFANKLREHEKQKEAYKAERQSIENYNASIDSKIEELIKFECGLHKLPKWQQAKVWWYAWDNGRYDGYERIYNILSNIMDLFEE